MILRQGYLYGIGAYVMWGILPLYWKLIDFIPAYEILAHRILWSFVFVLGILYFQGNIHRLKEVISDKNNVLRLFCSTVFITINWGLYIWAINSEHVVEASMGYYMNPLFVVLIGVLVLKEKLSIYQMISLFMAALGVVIITVQYGSIPWVSLILAISFAFYGLMKKKLKLDATVGLALETAILTPIVLSFILYRQYLGIEAIGTVSAASVSILIGSGIVTALPLLWFAEGANIIPLSSMGFLQYIAPTISLILGIFVFKESFTRAHMISFGFIWAGLIVYSLAQINEMRKQNIKKEIVKTES